MRIRASLTAGAIAAVAAIAFAVPGIAVAANDPAPASAATAAKAAATTSQPAFNKSSGGVTSGKVAGIIPAHGKASQLKAGIVQKDAGVRAAAAAPAACTEPNCNLVYNGGPVQHTPRVYVVFWGPSWNTSSHIAHKNYITNLFTALGQQSKGDSWSGVVQQYTDSAGGHPTFGTPLLAGSWVDTGIPANTSSTPITEDDLGTEAVNAANHFGIPDPTQADIVIVSQQGTCFDEPDPANAPGFTFAGNCGTPQTDGYCAYHSAQPVTTSTGATSYLPLVNLPYQPDAQEGCGLGFLSPGTNDGFSLSGAHELMEAITDPDPITTATLGWVDNSDGVSGGEVADKCMWAGLNWGQNPPDPAGIITLNGHSFAMQSLWSNAVSRCVMSGVLSLSVTTPATQSSTLGKAVSLQIHATVGGNTPLKYFASSLPPGLAISKSTGVISGTPGITAGTYTARAAAAYYFGPSKTVTFTWKVSSPKGVIRGWASKCVDDYAAAATAGNKIVLWTCGPGSGQQIVFAANRELVVVGKCITGTTTAAVLEPCTGATSQQWTRLSNGEYVLKSNGRCLTAPGQANGVQLALAACKNTGNQHWGLP